MPVNVFAVGPYQSILVVHLEMFESKRLCHPEDPPRADVTYGWIVGVFKCDDALCAPEKTYRSWRDSIRAVAKSIAPLHYQVG
jgi:hypothetical protein